MRGRGAGDGLELTALRAGGSERETIVIRLAGDHNGSAFEAAVLAAVSA